MRHAIHGEGSYHKAACSECGDGKMRSEHDDKMHKVMHEYKEGSLKSGSGERVTSRKQAIAIAMSEAGKARK